MTICRLRATSAGTTACSDSFSSQPPCCALHAYTVQPHSYSCSLAAGCAISTNSTTTTAADDDDAAAAAAAFAGSQPHRTRNQLQQQQPHSLYLAPLLLLNSSLLHRRLLWAECKGEPVVTKCRHYFCEPCALRLGTDAPCAARCGASCLPTSLSHPPSPSPPPPAPLSVWMRSQPQHQDWQVCSV